MRNSVSRLAREVGVFDRNGNRKYLNGGERKAYAAAIQAEANTERRAFLLTLYYTGCRISDALNLLVGQVDSTARGRHD